MAIVDKLVNSDSPAPRQGIWQQVLKDAVRDPVELCRLLELPRRYETSAMLSARLFPVFAPRGFIGRMRKRDVRDPLLRQVLPLEEEQLTVQGFSADPLEEFDQFSGHKPDSSNLGEPSVCAPASARSSGLLDKYRNRVLMVATGACAVHCRYCFRRHFPYSAGPRSPEDWRPALAQIAQDSSIHEVILSGGDPLTLVDGHLAELAQRLARIGHVRRLRVHTRLPIVIPERVTSELLDWLRGTRLAPLVVVHANHAAELSADVAAALAALVDAGVPVLNQSVLLRGVNDNLNALVELCERLVDLRVIPYYLHQLDRVAGAAHFEVDEQTGRRLMAELCARLPGYAVPRYVRELPGEPNKVVLG
jgi:EF-P beta-lysylation protein EpmB